MCTRVYTRVLHARGGGKGRGWSVRRRARERKPGADGGGADGGERREGRGAGMDR